MWADVRRGGHNSNSKQSSWGASGIGNGEEAEAEAEAETDAAEALGEETE